MYALLFVILVIAACVAGFFWVRRLKQQKIEQRKKQSELVAAAAPPPRTGNPATSGTTQPSPPPLPKLAISDEDATAYGDSLKTLMRDALDALRTAVKEAEAMKRAEERLAQATNEIRWHLMPPLSAIAASVPGFVELLTIKHCQKITAEAEVLRLTPTQMQPIQALVEKTKALRSALKRVQGYEYSQLPPSLAPIVRAATAIESHLQHQSRELSEPAAARVKQFVAPRKQSAGPDMKSAAASLKALEGVLVKAIEAYLEARKETTRIASSSAMADNVTKETASFREPKRPTTEEVAEYLAQVENWALRKLQLDNAAAVDYARFKQAYATYKAAYQTLEQALASFKSWKSKKLVPEIAAAIAGAEYFRDAYGATMVSECKQIDTEVAGKNFVAYQAVATETPAETTLVTELRKIFRTLGFAVAQANVASAKLQDLSGREPNRYASHPGVSTAEGNLDGFIAAWAESIDQQAGIDRTCELYDAEVGVAKGAFEARQDKTHKTAAQLSARLLKVQKDMTTDSATSLRVVVVAGQYLSTRHGEK